MATIGVCVFHALTLVGAFFSPKAERDTMKTEKVRFYKKKWFMCVCLIAFPPVGIIFLWTFQKEMKKTTRIILTIIFVLWIIILIGSGNDNDTQNISEPVKQIETAKPTNDQKEEQTTTVTPATKSKLETDGLSFNVSDVRNDVTGNWRVALIAENIQMQDYAVDYYNEYFKNDKEIHAIINFNYNTTTKLNVYGNTIYVTVYEYVKGEEHDAKLMYSGMLLKEYSVDKTTGEISEIS